MAPQKQLSSKYNQVPSLDQLESGRKITNKIGFETERLWKEFRILSRVIYRSKNQHRSSFAFHRLVEVKRVGERAGKLELWLKIHYCESGSSLYDFIGRLHTLRLLTDKMILACQKTFYFYLHYLNQALFVQLSTICISNISVIHAELNNWRRYINLLFAMSMERLRKQFPPETIEKWMQEHYIPAELDPVKEETFPNVPKSSDSASQPASSTKRPSNGFARRKSSNGGKKTSHADEIDDIFASF